MNYQKIESYELSNYDIVNIIGPTNIIKYPDLINYKSILDCFDSKGRCVIFFETVNAYSGHWTCCFKVKNSKTIMFFDPYGLPPDADTRYISQLARKTLKESKGLLVPLLYKAYDVGFTIMYNVHDYEEWKPNINTCGRFIAVRLLNQDKTEDQFFKYLNDYKNKNNLQNYDEVVSNIVYDIIGK